MRPRRICWMGAAMAVLVLQASTALAGDMAVDINADVSFLTDYVWRGQTYAEGGVVQPNFGIGFANGLSLGVWADYIVEDDLRGGSLVNEVDYTLDYSLERGPVGFSVGYIFYDFPGTPDGGNTEELYAGVSLNTVLSPTLTVYRDVDAIDGTYVVFQMEHSMELTDKTDLSFGGTLAWGSASYHEGYFGVKESSLSDYSLTASLSYALTKTITITPIISYTAFADKDIENAADAVYEEEKNISAGVNVGYSF